MTWTEALIKHGRIGNQRLRYAPMPDGKVRLFLLEPSPKGVLELIYTQRYETLQAGTACIAADFYAAQIPPQGVCPECWRELPRANAKYCCPGCAKRAWARNNRQKKIA